MRDGDGGRRVSRGCRWVLLWYRGSRIRLLRRRSLRSLLRLWLAILLRLPVLPILLGLAVLLLRLPILLRWLRLSVLLRLLGLAILLGLLGLTVRLRRAILLRRRLLRIRILISPRRPFHLLGQ